MTTLTIQEKADTLGTFRFILVRLMETLAEWVPTSPEMEVKTLFGRHIWQFAQHADVIGRRTVELRAKLHYERAPQESYASALKTARAVETSTDRLEVVYEVLIPDLAARIETYLARTDELLDAPSVEILRRILVDFERMHADCATVLAERPELQTHGEPATRLRAELSACVDVVHHREPVAR